MYVINNSDADLKFANSLLAVMLKESDIYKIKQKSSWDENRKEWTVPNFLLTEKKQDVTFPTINGKQRTEQVREERHIQFDGHHSETKS